MSDNQIFFYCHVTMSEYWDHVINCTAPIQIEQKILKYCDHVINCNVPVCPNRTKK